MPTVTDVERALRVLIDASDAIAVLYDSQYRIVYSSRQHRALLRVDACDLCGVSFHRFESEAQANLMQPIGGARGWVRDGIAKANYSLVRRAFERAGNVCDYAQRGTAWTIRDGLDSPLVLGITREIPVDDYVASPPVLLKTLDDPLM